MNFQDAKEVLAWVGGGLAALTTGFVVAWRQISRQRLESSTDNDERKRLADAFESSQRARERAHQLANDMMVLQRRMGQLESENEWCNKRTTALELSITELRDQNKQQGAQITALIRRNTQTDFGS